MTTILQLRPTVPLDTPKGPADAHFLLEYGEEHFLYWTCFVRETGECWTFRNDKVRLEKNPSMRPDSAKVMTKEEISKILMGTGG